MADIREQLLELVVSDLEKTRKFKRVYKNVVPIWTQVDRFPSVAVVYDYETNKRNDNSSCRVRTSGTITIYVYGKQVNAAAFEDVLSEPIKIVEDSINNNTALQEKVIDCLVFSVKQDAGMLHPHAMAELVVNLDYIKII